MVNHKRYGNLSCHFHCNLANICDRIETLVTQLALRSCNAHVHSLSVSPPLVGTTWSCQWSWTPSPSLTLSSAALDRNQKWDLKTSWVRTQHNWQGEGRGGGQYCLGTLVKTTTGINERGKNFDQGTRCSKKLNPLYHVRTHTGITKLNESCWCKMHRSSKYAKTIKLTKGDGNSSNQFTSN